MIDGAVGSAAEAVAYDLQQFKIAELLGAKTAGAANNNKLVPIAPGFILSISYARPIHVISKTNWEGIGVKPDVESDPNNALDVAQSLALKKLSEKTDVSAQVSNEYRWTQIAVEARLNPVIFTHERKKEFSGKFTSEDYGEIEVKFENEDLWLKRPNRPLAKLYPLAKEGLFGIEGNELLRVRLNGKTLELFWWEYPTPRIFSRL